MAELVSTLAKLAAVIPDAKVELSVYPEADWTPNCGAVSTHEFIVVTVIHKDSPQYDRVVLADFDADITTMTQKYTSRE